MEKHVITDILPMNQSTQVLVYILAFKVKVSYKPTFQCVERVTAEGAAKAVCFEKVRKTHFEGTSHFESIDIASDLNISLIVNIW